MKWKKLLWGNTSVRGTKTPKVKITMKDLLGSSGTGFSYKKRRGGTKLGSKANFKKMLRDV